MDLRFLLLAFAFIYFISLTLAAPRPPAQVIPNASENEIEENVVEGVKEDKEVDKGMDELELEYGRYLQEVVKALDEDPEFSKKLENITHDQIMSGHVAQQIASVAPDVRTKLDELKRVELDRLRKLAMKEHQLEEEIAREQEHGNNGVDNELDGRRWRTMRTGANKRATNNKADKTKPILDNTNAGHVDHSNPHTFEAEDLQKLIMKATHDLEELDRHRRRDFKQYEMEKEIHYREGLQNMTVEQKAEAEKKHNEEKAKHNQHAHVNHPGSKHQLEEVWEQQDHMPKQEFDPKIFFQMHDVNGDGFLDQEEVESLLSIEVKKIYNEKDPAYDHNEMVEEYHRMREHIYKEIDANHDGLISKKEFVDYTKSAEFEKDDGWKGIEEAPVYTEEELKHYEQQRQQLQDHYAKYGAYQMPYHPNDIPPPGYGQQPMYYQQHPNDPNYAQHHPNDPNAYGQYHPNDPNHPMAYGQQHPGQQVQYVHATPQHVQKPMQVHHVELPPQHYVNGQLQHPSQQQQMHPQQGTYQALPPAQQQHPGQPQQYMPNQNVPQLPPAQQQQHPGQPQQQVYNAPHPAQVNAQGQHMQMGQPQQQYVAQPQQGQQVPPAQQQQHYAAVPPAQVHPAQAQAVPNQQQQQYQQPQQGQPQQQHPNNPGQHH